MVPSLNVALAVRNRGEIELRDTKRVGERGRERERGRDDYKFDIPRRVWIGRATEKGSRAKCGLPNETGRVLEKGKWERWKEGGKERERLYLNVSLPCEWAGRPGDLSLVLNKPLAENQAKQLAVSTEHGAEGSHTLLCHCLSPPLFCLCLSPPLSCPWALLIAPHQQVFTEPIRNSPPVHR